MLQICTFMQTKPISFCIILPATEWLWQINLKGAPSLFTWILPITLSLLVFFLIFSHSRQILVFWFFKGELCVWNVCQWFIWVLFYVGNRPNLCEIDTSFVFCLQCSSYIDTWLIDTMKYMRFKSFSCRWLHLIPLYRLLFQ